MKKTLLVSGIFAVALIGVVSFDGRGSPYLVYDESGNEVVSGAVTDSGRVFINGRSPNEQYTVLEISGGGSSNIDVTRLSNDNRAGHLVGSDGESLVFFSNSNHQFIWFEVN